MIPAEAFKGNVVAQLHYAAGLSPEEASVVLESRLEDQTWTATAALWVEVACGVDRRSGRSGMATALVARLARQLMGVPISADLHDFLPRVFAELIAAPTTAASIGPVLDPLVGWIAQSAKAGDAGLVAKILNATRSHLSSVAGNRDWQIENISQLLGLHSQAESSKDRTAQEQSAQEQRLLELRRRTDLLRSFVPLAQWMIEKGAAELRQPGQGPLLVMLLECLAEGKPAELQLVLRFLSLHARPEEGVETQHMELFWQVAERVLEEGATGTLICELVAAMYRGNWWAEHCSHPLQVPKKLPRASQAILQGLVEGRFEAIAHGANERFHPVTWRLAFQHPPGQSKPLRFLDVPPLSRALEILGTAASETNAPTAVADWAHYLVKEWIRLHGLRARKDLEPLLKLTALPGLGAAVAIGLEEALKAAPPTDDTPLALRILHELGGTPDALRAVLTLELERPDFTRRATASLSWLQDEFRRVLHLPWTEPVFGIDLPRMFQGARDVRFAALPQAAQVEVRGDCVTLHEPSYQQLVASISDREELLATAMLYFLHEWVHVQQNIGQKRMVDLLREAAGESTLMQLDLSADHAAAQLTRRVEPRWNLAWLKGLQSRSLLSYPAGRGHTTASRGRKTTRFISLRLDYLVRTASRTPGWFSKLGEGYVFVDLSPGGGAMFLLVSGPPLSVVDHTRLSSEQAAFLTAIMDEREEKGDRLTDLDALLRISFRVS
ncbi:MULTISPECIES: hypothetical protein [Corallococcus]|uniref:hypothetical protein n=1 Tax=Corallococcus TaxID=83461 RepID=UPI0011C3EE22|nr:MULTISPECIES: hypothetical protein [Corallococcus]